LVSSEQDEGQTWPGSAAAMPAGAVLVTAGSAAPLACLTADGLLQLVRAVTGENTTAEWVSATSA